MHVIPKAHDVLLNFVRRNGSAGGFMQVRLVCREPSQRDKLVQLVQHHALDQVCTVHVGGMFHFDTPSNVAWHAASCAGILCDPRDRADLPDDLEAQWQLSFARALGGCFCLPGSTHTVSYRPVGQRAFVYGRYWDLQPEEPIMYHYGTFRHLFQVSLCVRLRLETPTERDPFCVVLCLPPSLGDSSALHALILAVLHTTKELATSLPDAQWEAAAVQLARPLREANSSQPSGHEA